MAVLQDPSRGPMMRPTSTGTGTGTGTGTRPGMWWP